MTRTSTHLRTRGPRASARSGRGTTLVELAIALAVMALLLAMGMPSYQDLRKRQQVDATLHLLTSHLATARVTAITQNVPVIVCPSAGDGRCSADSDWSANWLMFRDPDGNRQPDDDLDIYRNEQAPQKPGLRIFSTVGRPHVRYQPSGMSYGSNLTIRVCYDDLLVGSVVVNNSGRARSHRPTANRPCNG